MSYFLELHWKLCALHRTLAVSMLKNFQVHQEELVFFHFLLHEFRYLFRDNSFVGIDGYLLSLVKRSHPWTFMGILRFFLHTTQKEIFSQSSRQSSKVLEFLLNICSFGLWGLKISYRRDNSWRSVWWVFFRNEERLCSFIIHSS